MKEFIRFDEYGNELDEWVEMPVESELHTKHLTREIISQLFEKEKELRELSGKERNAYRLRHIMGLRCYKSMYHDLSPFEENGKWGVKNNVFDLVTLAPIYDEVQPFCTDEAFDYTFYKVKSGDKYGCVHFNKNGGKMIVPPIYDDVMTLDDYLGEETYEDDVTIVIKQNGKYGISYGSQVDLEPVYDKITLKDYDYLLTEKNGKFGLSGKGIRIPAEYDEIQVPEIMGWIKARKGDVWGYFDVDCHFTEDVSKAFQTRFQWFWDFEDDNQDRLNELFDDYSSFLNRLSFRKLKEIVTVEELEGENVFDKKIIYKDRLSGKVGLRLYITATDLIPARYDGLQYIADDGFVYQLNGKYGCVLADGKGTELCPPVYDEIKKAECGEHVVFVRIGEKWGVVDFHKKDIPAALEYDEIIEDGHGWDDFKLLLKKGSKLGLHMKDIFIPPLYDGLYVPEISGWIRVCKDGEWGYLDVDNEFTPDESRAYLCYWVYR